MSQKRTRQNFSQHERERIVQEITASGLTPTAYAKTHGLIPRSIRNTFTLSSGIGAA